MFDLDGTLVQTRGASWDVFRQISDEFGLGLTGPQEYFDLFRGNIFASLDSLCDGHADSEQVKQAFLERLRAEYNPAMVPGMVDVIRRLAGHCTLAVVSSNAMEVLRRVLVDNGVAYCFAHVFGGDAVPDKTAAFRSFLADAASQYGRRCEVTYDETPGATRPDLSTTVLVTDTAGDVRDALAAGIRAVGVAWGMHTADELTAVGAEFVAIWPQELPGYLLSGTVPEPTGACAVPPPPGTIAPPPVGPRATVPPPTSPRGTAHPPARVGGSCGAEPGACGCGCSAADAKPPAPQPVRPSPAPPAVRQPLAVRLTPAAAAQVVAAATRRDRRQQAAQLLGNRATADPFASTEPASSSRAPAAKPSPRPPGPPAATTELRDAVARILTPVPGQ
jgi:phosphoglycolate phosphatase